MLSVKYLAVKASFTLTILFVVLLFRASSPLRLEGYEHATLPPSAPIAFSDVTDNSTFGFPKIFLINLPTRFDLLDAATIQAFLSGVQFEVFPAVETDMIKDKGMPPTRDKERLKQTEKGCWRAHANIWSHMLRNDLPVALIMEADVAWDINVRTIMTKFHENFTSLLQQLNSTQLPRIRKSRTSGNESVSNIFPDPEDPWHSKHWDILSVGHCTEDPRDHEHMIKYDDEHVPPGKDYYGQTLGSERVVRKSGGIACTTAYAVSRSGAAKLLLRSATNLDLPVDLVIKQMTMTRDMIAYSVHPPIMAQWKYMPGIGMNLRGSNSDVQDIKDEVNDDDEKAWDTVYQTKSVWAPGDFATKDFIEMAMHGAWNRIFEGERPPSQVTLESG
ncbi:hypothetical protein CORC01_10359 [Colletotrichum orchidophilum]|uniref:Glycosyl transferase family 25 domain-containing protein n=1 Tax=Colletotrichum orchidophilum TaxID=1209926 RepID=A0A1G4AZ46_9PEZI|nr:uncharacterized protein CORC01_10359 [Colletotrichum orchidophilum]OHE94312.1 hypothetical protein CORC01_10359 [Colletotrichum orchidophilum]